MNTDIIIYETGKKNVREQWGSSRSECQHAMLTNTIKLTKRVLIYFIHHIAKYAFHYQSIIFHNMEDSTSHVVLMYSTNIALIQRDSILLNLLNIIEFL